METKFIEASQSPKGEGLVNWGKFMLGRFTEEEWARPTEVGHGQPLLPACGWAPYHLWVLDLQTGEGAFLSPGGSAHADLQKHAVWVCPMFEPFLEWLYQQELEDLDALPSLVELPEAEFSLSGYRRPGSH